MSTPDLVPHPARIAAVVPECADTRTFVLALDPPLPALDAARPGQFLMLSVFGHGEAPFTPSALLGGGVAPGTAVVTVRRVGRLTGALFALPIGAMVGVRGPFGRGFPDPGDGAAVYVAGGCGLSPLRAAISAHVATRTRDTRLAIVYGARDEEARIHRWDLAAWRKASGVRVIECVEQAGARWRGRVGSVLDCVDEAVARVGARRALVCGPPAMLPLVAERLCRCGVRATDVHVSIERYMKCGVGRCGHCYVNARYACTDGPVFSYAELQALPDAL